MYENIVRLCLSATIFPGIVDVKTQVPVKFWDLFLNARYQPFI